MKRVFAATILTIFLMVATSEASFEALSANLSSYANAYASSGMSDYSSDSAVLSSSSYTSVNAFATSMGSYGDPFGGGGGMEMGPMADGMSDASISLYSDGFTVMGHSHAGVSTGPGNSSASHQLSFIFNLTETSSCEISAMNNFGSPYGSAYSSLYLTDSASQNIIAFSSNDSINTIIELAAGQYTLTGSSSASVDIYSSAEGMIWDAGGTYDIALHATAVPEPATLVLLLGGALLLKRRR